MREALLDTDILSEILKGRSPAVTARAKAYAGRFGRLATSSLSIMEIAKGFQRHGRRTDLEAFPGLAPGSCSAGPSRPPAAFPGSRPSRLVPPSGPPAPRPAPRRVGRAPVSSAPRSREPSGRGRSGEREGQDEASYPRQPC